MNVINHLASITISIALLSFTCHASQTLPNETLIHVDDVKWGYLNPLRGAQSPGAANLWGDRTKNRATGMLVRFNEGFSSPAHIHNISYRGIVIEGLIHNDDPTAAKMWMPAGSFWTQAAGEDHVTAAAHKQNLIYLEIDEGPYLVKTSSHSFNNGETSLNLHFDNLVWKNTNTPAEGHQSARKSYLWGSTENGSIRGTLIQLPAGYNGRLVTKAIEFRAVLIKGNLSYQNLALSKETSLSPGSYFSSIGEYQHVINSPNESLIYIRSNQDYQLIPN